MASGSFLDIGRAKSACCKAGPAYYIGTGLSVLNTQYPVRVRRPHRCQTQVSLRARLTDWAECYCLPPPCLAEQVSAAKRKEDQKAKEQNKKEDQKIKRARVDVKKDTVSLLCCTRTTASLQSRTLALLSALLAERQMCCSQC